MVTEEEARDYPEGTVIIDGKVHVDSGPAAHERSDTLTNGASEKNAEKNDTPKTQVVPGETKDQVHVYNDEELKIMDVKHIADLLDNEFKGICLGHSIRQSDIETDGVAGDDRTDAVADLINSAGGLLTPGKMIKYLKPSGGRYKVRVMFHGKTTAVTVESGAPVYFKETGSTIGSTLSGLGNFFCDPACTDDATIIGRLAKATTIPDATTNDVNVESEMWY